jgi:NADPH-dependent 2,4-dienoyl-CoA reductase/sulfur reductase-like enzyme
MSRFEVVIGGSGPAAIEAALALRRLAGGLVETTLVTPDEDCVHLPMTRPDPDDGLRREMAGPTGRSALDKIAGRELSRHLTRIPARIGKGAAGMRANGL